MVLLYNLLMAVPCLNSSVTVSVFMPISFCVVVLSLLKNIVLPILFWWISSAENVEHFDLSTFLFCLVFWWNF